MGERRRSALEREEHARRLLGRDRAPARMDQLDEAVGGVERELHRRSTVYEHMFVFKAETKGRPAGGPS